MQCSSKSIQTISNGNIQCFTKNPVPLLGVSYNLGISSANIQNNWILGSRDLSPHFNMPYTVVYTNQWLSPKKAQRTGCDGNSLERCSHSRAFGVAYAVNVGK